MSATTLLLGAVAYDAKVVPIWEGIRAHFQAEGVPLDFALFSNYERQVEELLAGHIDIAWNTPLAHVRVEKRTGGRSRALGMRDSDRDFHAKIVARKDAKIRTLAISRASVSPSAAATPRRRASCRSNSCARRA